MASPFRPALELLTMYAAYHRDRRNIATHLVGIPMIVFAIAVLLARPVTGVGGFMLAPIHVVYALATAWYLTRGALALGLATSVINGVLVALALPLAAASTGPWLAWGLGAFVLGWIIQFVGHVFEGRKPAFADDIVGLLVGPMFVVAEVMFALGWGRALRADIESRVGPTRGASLHARGT